MKPSKTVLICLFLVGALVTGSLVISCSSQDKKGASPAAAQAPKATVPEVKAPPPAEKKPSVSVDFDHVPLSDVAVFVTDNTGKGFVLNGTEKTTITWIEYNIPREKLLDSFLNILAASNLVVKPTGPDQAVFTIGKLEEKVLYKLNFATSSRGVFFLLGNTVYPKDKFPHQLQYSAGHWYALLPQDLADQLNSTEANRHAKM